MRVRFYRSLDRSVQYFGVRGRFTVPVVAGGVASLVLAAFVGGMTNGLVGIAAFLMGFFSVAMFVVALQGRVTERALMRRLAMGRCFRFLRVSPRRGVRRGTRLTERSGGRLRADIQTKKEERR